ncbi:MAG: 23S rRNA (adenine(2503)-C(2))-methyltransferase RlmN [Bacteroidetes bacterium]|nr:23S rRNA (adenine(2503)-C(2))-methyltransferase RlmN [Bacteroidota bacterium]
METQKLIDIRSLSQEQIKEVFLAKGEKAFRATQVYEWLWKKTASDFKQMSNLSIDTRNWPKENYVINHVKVVDKQISSDKTIKSGFKLHDNHLVEGVLIPADDRMTACVSSQVGCSLTCKFCATGYMDRKRNLDPGEIYDQVVTIARQAEENFGQKLTNIVYMGMGEPLLNYANVWDSIERITSPTGLNMAAKRITVSTAGIAKMIKKLADDGAKFNLAVSLHAADDVKRDTIMPINESNSLEAVGKALQHFYNKTKSRITFEYIAFKDFNESIEDAKMLLKFCKKVPAKVNVIEYNPTGDGQFEKADSKKIDAFCAYLEKNGVKATVRRSRGNDIDAACGQLANKNKLAMEQLK